MQSHGHEAVGPRITQILYLTLINPEKGVDHQRGIIQAIHQGCVVDREKVFKAGL